MASVRTVAILVFTYVVCAGNCGLSKQTLEELVESHVHRILNSKEQMKIEIIVTGESGVGKSTLINALVGKNITKTGNNVTGVTRSVDGRGVVINGILVYITDTPGLGDLRIGDDDTLKTAQEHSKNVDLLLFCLKMTERLRSHHITEIESITKRFGQDIWKKSLIVLTFANDEKRFFSKLEEWKKEIQEFVYPKVAEKIPIIPTGFMEPQLPDRPSWVSEFWIQAFRRMSYKAMVYFTVLSQDRIHDTTAVIKPTDDMYGYPENHPLVICYMSEEESSIDPERFRMISQVVGGILFSVMASLIPGVGYYYIPVALPTGKLAGKLTANFVLKNFGAKEEEICFDVILYSLTVAFLQEFPEYEQLLLD